MKNKFLLFILLVGTISISCDHEDDLKPVESVSLIVDAELPATGNVGQEINFIVHHGVSSGCGEYSSQKTTQTGNTLIVTFFAQYREGGCTMDAPILKTNYKFVPTQTGTYTFKFNSGEEKYLVKTIQID